MQTRLSPEIRKASRFVRITLLLLVLAQAVVLQLSRPRLLVHADSNRLSLAAGRQFPVTYKGSHRATTAMAGHPTALSMAAADLDGDGIGDLAIGFASGGSGLIAIHHGNLDAFAPQTEATFWAIARGDFPSPYLPEADVVEIPTQPDFLAEGDLIGLKGSALAAAARGGNSISVLTRNESGRMEVQQTISVDGSITAMDSHDLAKAKFGHLVVGVHTDSGSRLLIYTGSHDGLVQTGDYPLQGDATSFASGNLDADGIPDLLVVAGGQVSILHSASKELEAVSTPFMVAAATAGRFVHDRGPLFQMALLSTDGSLHIMAADNFDSTPYTLQELQANRKARMMARLQRKQSSATAAITRMPQRNVGWREVETTSGAGAPDASGKLPFLFRAHMSNSPVEDVMLMSAAKISVVAHPTAQAGAAQIMDRPDLGADAVAAVPVRASVDWRQGVVYMLKGHTSPIVVIDQANATFNVNTTADTITANACANATANACSLREAIIEANAGTGTDTIMIPNGTYTLTILRKSGTQLYDAKTGTLDVTQNVNIVGSGQSTTIIQGGTKGVHDAGGPNGVDKVFSFNQDINAYTNATVTVQNLTIQNGNNKGDATTTFDGWGGAFDCDTGTAGNASLTLTNVTLTNNTFTQGEGGAFATFNDVTGGTGLVTVTNGIISNNVAVTGSGEFGNGGGIAVEDAASLTMSNTTVTGNTTTEYGGGIYDVGSGFALAGGGFVNNQVTLHAVTISNNTASFGGAGLNSNGGGLTIDQASVISGNTAHSDGGGIYAAIYSNSNFPAFTVAFSNITVTGNSIGSPGGFGGGIKINGGFPSGTPFTMAFSRIAGNSATSGDGQQFSWQGASGETIDVHDNWWGTNADPTTGGTSAPIVIDTNGTTAGTLTYIPWLVLSLSASPSTVTNGGSDTSTLTASFLKDSNGSSVSASNLGVLNGVAISFANPVHGSLSGAQSTIQSSATATATFTGTTIGLGTAQATVDAATVTSGNIVVNSTTATAASNASATFNTAAQNVTLSASVSAASTQTVAAGTVTFSVFNGATQIGSAVTSATVSGGSASATFSLPAGTGAGSYSIHAAYNGTSTGNGDFLTSSDTTHTLTVSAASTTTVASTATAAFSASAQNVTLSATVTSSAGTVGVGTVTFTVINSSSVVVGTATTSSTVSGGNASVSYALPASTPVGAYTIQAAYTGNANLSNSSDSSHTLTISATTTTAGSNATATFGLSNQNVTLTASVTSAAGTVNGGTVTFGVFNGATQIGSSTSGTVSNGSASATYVLPGGTGAATYSIHASYGGSGSFGSSSDTTHTLTVSPASSTTAAVNANASFSASAQNVTLSALVTSPAGTVAVGTVTFTLINSSSVVVGTATTSATVSGGNASVSYALPASTPIGTYTIQAAYTGTANISNSSDSTHTLTIATTTTTAAGNASATYSLSSQNVTLSASVTSPGGTVNAGTVTFGVFNGATQIGSSTSGSVSNGSASATYSLPGGSSAGTYSIHASYGGSGSFGSSSDTTHNLTVNAASTTTAGANASATFSTSAQNVSLSALVTSAAGTVGVGTVTFTLINSSSVVVGTPTTSSTVTGGNASVNYSVPASTPIGTYTIQAAYTGNSNLGNSTDSTHTLTISSATSTTTTTGANASATYNLSNQNVTLSATVTSSGGTVNAGTVTFGVFNGATQIGSSTSGTVSNGSASATYSLPGGSGAGSYSIHASYGGSGSFGSSSDTTHNLTVSAASTTTAGANASATFSASAQNVTLNATVTSPSGTVGAGTVTFTLINSSSVVVGTPTTSSTVTGGNASVSYALPASTPVGTYTIQAAYTGNSNLGNSTDSTHTLTISSGTSTTTTTAGNASATFNSSAQNVTLSATVTSSGGTVNAGSVTFSVFSGVTQIGSSTAGSVTNGSAMATFALPGGTGAGTYSIVASYGGSGSFGSSSDNTHVLTVSSAMTITTGANASVTFSASSQVVPLSATVASTGGSVNGGTVTFTVLSGITTIGSPVSGAVSGGTASANYTLPGGTTAGPYTIQAAFSGTSNFIASTDSTHTLTVSAAGGPALTVVSFNVLFGSESYNLSTSSRNRLPWQITGIQVVFSEPVTSGDINSLTGLTTTGFSGLGTNTLTWSISPVALGSFAATLMATGPDALTDANANALNNGISATQALKVLWGDVNDDGVVNSADVVLTNNATVQPYNVIYDLNGDGLVNSADVLVVRARLNTKLP